MAAGDAGERAVPRTTGVPLLAVLGVLAVGACVIVAVVSLMGRRVQLLERDAQIAAERRAAEVVVAVRDAEATLARLDPSRCDLGAGAAVGTPVASGPARAGATLLCLPAGAAAEGAASVELRQPTVQVALARSADLGVPVLSASSPDARPVLAAPVYLVDGRLSLVASRPRADTRRAELAGHALAVLDVDALVDGGGDWRIEDGSVVLGGAGPGPDDRERAAADVTVLDRRWTVSTPVPTLGLWRPVATAVAALGLAGVALLGLADRQRRRAMQADGASMRDAEQRAVAIRTLTGIVQESQDLDEILPGLAVQLSDELALAGLSLAITSSNGGERAIFSHGVKPDPTAAPGAQRPPDVPPGATLAVGLHRAERSVAILRVVAGEPLDRQDMELLEVAGELITSTIVAGRSIEQQQEAVNRLESLDELKTTFLGVASHELRTPATAISGLASLLASRWDELTEVDRRAFATRIATNADALNSLVQDLLDFARIERGDLRLALAPVDLSATVERVLTRLDSVWGSHAVLRRISDGVEVLGDGNALERVITNLVSNAVKFSPDGADVTVTVEEIDGQARLLVDDAGTGVPPEEREKIFVRFYRGTGDAVVRTRGVGIGLSVVHDFVSQMGGSVRVEDSPAGGARFTVELDALDHSAIGERDAATT